MKSLLFCIAAVSMVGCGSLTEPVVRENDLKQLSAYEAFADTISSIHSQLMNMMLAEFDAESTYLRGL